MDNFLSLGFEFCKNANKNVSMISQLTHKSRKRSKWGPRLRLQKAIFYICSRTTINKTFQSHTAEKRRINKHFVTAKQGKFAEEKIREKLHSTKKKRETSDLVQVCKQQKTRPARESNPPPVGEAGTLSCKASKEYTVKFNLKSGQTATVQKLPH